MSALNIPGRGEKPGCLYRKVVSFSAKSSDGYDVAVASGNNVLININEAGVFIEGFEVQCTTAFTATAALLMGDSADCDGWGTDTAMNIAATATVWKALAASMPYAGGKLYTSTDAIAFHVTGTPAAGCAKLRVTYQIGLESDTDFNCATG